MDRASHDELAWLAFRYVAGELTAEEESGFEERLAEDQLARDAVDHAVELGEAVRLVSAESASAPRPRVRFVMRPFLAWGTVVACLAVVAGVSWLAATGKLLPVARNDRPAPVPNLADPDSRDPDSRDPDSRDPDSRDPDSRDNVALVWAGLRFGPGKARPGAATWPTAMADEQAVEIDTGMEAADESQPSVPGWLLTAFSAGTEPPRELP